MTKSQIKLLEQIEDDKLQEIDCIEEDMRLVGCSEEEIEKMRAIKSLEWDVYKQSTIDNFKNEQELER